MADLLAVLYGGTLRVDPRRPDWADRDRFILSKGHGAAILYAALAESGIIPRSWLDRYGEDGGPLPGHVDAGVPGVEISTGSLGHGLSIACGMALAAKRKRRSHRVIALLSDGELDEGSTWEAILFAPQHGLDNLTAIVDYNKIQSLGHVRDVIDLEPLAAKWTAFRWAAREIDGHDHSQIAQALGECPFKVGSPSVIIAHTVKGKGVSFMEGQLAWHYQAPDDAQLVQALTEVGAPE